MKPNSDGGPAFAKPTSGGGTGPLPGTKPGPDDGPIRLLGPDPRPL
jgi:hypothetical protein